MPTPAAPPGTLEPRRERLAGLALVVEAAHDAHDGFGCVLRRDLRGLLAELHLGVGEVAAEQHLVARRGAPVRPPLEPEEPDVADVVLAAAVRAARDVDAHAGNLGEALFFEPVADRRGKPTRLRDREVAGVGARAADDVACELGAGLRHADVGQPVVERPQVGLVQVAQREVLAVRHADVEIEVALDVGEPAELLGGDVADAGVRHRADRAAVDAAHDVRLDPPLVRVGLEQLHRRVVGPDLGRVG